MLRPVMAKEEAFMTCSECGRSTASTSAYRRFVSDLLFTFGWIAATVLFGVMAASVHDDFVEDFEDRIKHPDEYRMRLERDREWMEMYEAAQP
ncbi:hypothetical protein [Novosphingobium sp. P6W]|uniref:hypothetical protein n=1 Tax=Novosphingobium sp. P6W TaxID=1609758 RepID=UPI0013B447F9|nr:hypothetical protein [Novosphingobium sp. P6W]